MTLKIEVEAYPGFDIPTNVIPSMVMLANHLHIDVWAKLNGVRVVAKPHDDPKDIAASWRIEMRSKKQYPIASARKGRISI